jgi:hypothetical protein
MKYSFEKFKYFFKFTRFQKENHIFLNKYYKKNNSEKSLKLTEKVEQLDAKVDAMLQVTLFRVLNFNFIMQILGDSGFQLCKYTM